MQWRPPIIPYGYGAEIAAARSGHGENGWNSMQDLHHGGDVTASDYLRGDAVANLPVAEPVQAPHP